MEGRGIDEGDMPYRVTAHLLVVLAYKIRFAVQRCDHVEYRERM